MSEFIEYNGSQSLDKIIHNIQELLSRSKRPVLVSVAGGSATGKTSEVARHIAESFKSESLLLSQDRFQLGEDFSELETSPYKWDDPGNFAIDETFSALRELLLQGKAFIPNFSLKTLRRGESTLEQVDNKRLIVFEGLYALRDNLNELSNLNVYVEASAYARLMRRIFRFTIEMNIPKPETALRQVVDRVIPAHLKFVVPQREYAEYVVRTPYSFDETRKKYQGQFTYFDIPEGQPLWEYSTEPGVALRIYETEGEYAFYVVDNGHSVFKAHITITTKLNLEQLDFDAF